MARDSALGERRSSRCRAVLIPALVIAAATALVYSNTFDASFHLDDFSNIVQNESLRDLGRWWPPSGRRWLGYLTFALDYSVGGLDVFGYHLVNVAIHVCNGLLVFWLAAATLRTPALRTAEAGPLTRRHLPVAAGLIFAVHPLATQAVTYIVQRFTSLATLFFLLSLASYGEARLSLEADRRSKLRAWLFYVASVVAAAGAMKTKEISFTLPVVAVVYEMLFFRSGRKLLLVAPLAATALLVPLGLAGVGESLSDVLGDTSRFAAETRDIPRSVYLLTESRVVVTYLRLLLFPVGQNFDHDVALSRSLAEPGVLFALAVLAGLAIAAVAVLARARRENQAAGVLVFFAVAWFFVTLAVESSVIPIRDVMFEHRVYLPSAGAAIGIAAALLWAVERLRFRSPPALQCAAALVIFAGPLAGATYARNSVYEDDLTLWSDVVSKSPGKARAHDELGLAYKDKGRLEDAIREYREAIRLDPELALAHNHLGSAYQERGQLDAAIREYRAALRFAPGLAEAHLNLGLAHGERGERDDELREYREAVRLAPGLAEAHMDLGAAYAERHLLDDAIRELRETIRLDPGRSAAHINLGLAYETKGELDAAVREYREGIRLAPSESPQAHISIARILTRQGRTAEAAEEYRRARTEQRSR